MRCAHTFKHWHYIPTSWAHHHLRVPLACRQLLMTQTCETAVFTHSLDLFLTTHTHTHTHTYFHTIPPLSHTAACLVSILCGRYLSFTLCDLRNLLMCEVPKTCSLIWTLSQFVESAKSTGQRKNWKCVRALLHWQLSPNPTVIPGPVQGSQKIYYTGEQAVSSSFQYQTVSSGCDIQ